MTAENMNNQEMGQPAELFIKKTYGSFTCDVRLFGRKVKNTQKQSDIICECSLR